MILYNVTVKVDPEVEAEWVEWMKTVHIPDVLKSGLFERHHFLKFPDETGNTYAVQYWLKDSKDFEKYQEEFAPALQADHNQRFKDKFVAFRTIMEEV